MCTKQEIRSRNQLKQELSRESLQESLLPTHAEMPFGRMTTNEFSLRTGGPKTNRQVPESLNHFRSSVRIQYLESE